eukprot:m.47184 g.47184  ORF g.47184 m.47184 type:complete len:365 (+) comp10961_c1_seq2:2034-3128(+)
MAIRVGILSTANIANKNVRAIGEAEAIEVVAVASRSLEKAQAFASKHGIPTAFGSYDELLACAEVDAVYIPLPTTMHKEWVTKAAQAGKHVLCEKPVAISTEELKEMLTACKENNVVWMDGVMFMHQDRVVKVQETIKEHGPITYLMSGFSFAADEEFLTTNIRVSSKLDFFGALGDLGWYCIRATLMANEWQVPSRVTTHVHKSNPGNVPLDSTSMLFYDDGRMATFHTSFMHGFRQWLDMAGKWGRIKVDDFVIQKTSAGCEFTVVEEPHLEDDHRRVEQRVSTQEVAGCGEVEMWSRFSRLIRNKRDGKQSESGDVRETEKFWCDVSVSTQAVLDACYASAYSNGEAVDVDVNVVQTQQAQ